MKNLFPGHYRPSDDELKKLWEVATFVLDTNTLLNLYRYTSETREDFLKVLQQIKGRLWIPHQVALEFQENRLGVITAQGKRFDEVRNLINEARTKLDSDLVNLQLEKRHSLIKPSKFLSNLAQIFQEFEAELLELEKGQISITDRDELREKIDALLEGRVGQPPKNQKWLDDICAQGEERYKRRVPPGYGDVSKKKDEGAHVWGGLNFRRLYGDLILWEELIEAAKEDERLKNIVFICDDRKDDWWWVTQGKTLGPHPELVREIRHRAGVKQFYMYTPERFLGFANTTLGAEVKESSIQQIRDVASVIEEDFGRNDRYSSVLQAKGELLTWMHAYIDAELVPVESSFQPFDYIAVMPGVGRIGIDIRYVFAGMDVLQLVHSSREQGEKAVESGDVDRFVTCLVAMNEDVLKSVVASRSLAGIRSYADIWYGYMSDKGIYHTFHISHWVKSKSP